jgi:transcription initiation factor TFIIB
LYNVFDKLYQNSSSVGIPTKVIEDAKVLYKRASEKKISRGDNKEGLIASCIYYSCLINKIPRSPKEVARIFHIDPNILNKGNSRFQGLLQMNINSSNPDDYIPRFGSKLNLDCNDIQKCKELAKTIDNLEIIKVIKKNLIINKNKITPNMTVNPRPDKYISPMDNSEKIIKEISTKSCCFML